MRRLAATICCVLAMMIAQQAAAQQPCPVLTVDSTGDDITGDISSPCALIANPGSDGITLRAALFAANNATGSGLMTIAFAPSLAGQTISTTGGLGNPYVSRNDIAIIGLVDSNGQPTVTIDVSPMGSGILMTVDASNFTLASLRFTGFQGSQNAGTAAQGIAIEAGALGTGSPYYFPGNQQVSGITVRGNVFDNTSNSSPTNDGNYLSLGMQAGSSGALLSNVIITGNTFTNFQGNSDGILVGPGGTNNVLQNFVIAENSFSNITYPVEIGVGSSTNSNILHFRVIDNSFVSNLGGISLGGFGTSQPDQSGNLVDDTLIEGNQFQDNRGPEIGLGFEYTFGDTLGDTQIINNLIVGDTQYGGISVTGGREDGAGNTVGNTVQGVTITNNTIANYSGSNGDGGAISVNANLNGASGNTVSGVTVLNTILWNNTPSDFDGVSASQVTTSITAQAGFAGVNGNIASNPQFVNPSDNFELQSGSPALHAGTSPGAAAIDIDCQPRGAPPSIGAYEYQGPDICPATYSPPLPLTATSAAGEHLLAVDFRTSGLGRGKSYIVNFGDGSIGPVSQYGCFDPSLGEGGQGGIQCSGSAAHTYAAAGTYTATLVSVSGGRLGSSVTFRVRDLRPLAAGAVWWREVPAR